MSRRVRFRPRAEADVDEQFGYFAERSTDLAHRFVDAMHETAARLAEASDLGIRYDSVEARLTDMLAWKVKGFPNHLIFYRAATDGIEIVRVLHGARDIRALFKSGELQ